MMVVVMRMIAIKPRRYVVYTPHSVTAKCFQNMRVKGMASYSNVI